MLSNVPRRQTFSEKGDMASVQGGWRRRAGLIGLGMYSTGRCQWLPWTPATIFCATHVLSAMQNNTDLSNECRACEKGGVNCQEEKHGLAHCASNDAHTSNNYWALVLHTAHDHSEEATCTPRSTCGGSQTPRTTCGTPVANIDNTGDLQKDLKKLNSCSATLSRQYIQRPRVHEQESLRMSAGRRAR